MAKGEKLVPQKKGEKEKSWKASPINHAIG